MKRARAAFAYLIIIINCTAVAACAPPGPPPVELVNVFAGTGGTGFAQGSAYPGAVLPFGLVKLSPDTNGGPFGRLDFAHFAGYYRDDTRIEGFSHTHLHGTGAVDYGFVTLMPTLGWSEEKSSYPGYQMEFSHDAEFGAPGLYKVTLADGITAELTATRHAGVHRYTFPGAADAVVIVDLGHGIGSTKVKSSSIELLAAEKRVRGELQGGGALSGRFGGVTVFMDAVFDRAWEDGSSGTWDADGHAGAHLHFGAAKAVEARVGISFTSADAARANREAETAGATFDDLRARARDAWARELSRIEIWGGTPDQRATFYSALYHAFQMPTEYSDAGAGERFFSDMSLWDTYRTLHPLLHLIAPEYAADFLRSLLKMGTARGALPRWPIAHGDGNSMIGTPADIVAADARLRGVAGPDYEALYALMKKAATEGDPNGMRSARESYAALGYCPADEVGGSVSVTLEQMWADFAIGQLGTALGKPDDPAMFAARAARFGEIYDGPRGFFRGRKADGTFLAAGGFDPTTNTEEYVEGNAWQYLWLAPWNADELARVLGGRDAAVAKLDEFFRLSMERPPEELAGVRLPDLYYWHGNEPGLHTAYLYVLWRRPDKAAEVVRWILRSKYANAPAGLDGNDDGGTLSSWYVWSAMGLYPIAATSRYLVGSPLFTRSVIRLAGGKSFTIEAAKASAENMYVQSAAWDGKPLLDPWFDHSDVAKGGTLALEMGSAPSDWGR